MYKFRPEQSACAARCHGCGTKWPLFVQFFTELALCEAESSSVNRLQLSPSRSNNSSNRRLEFWAVIRRHGWVWLSRCQPCDWSTRLSLVIHLYKCADNVRAGLNLKEIHKQKLKGVLHLGVAGAGPFGCEKTGCVISGVRKFEILFYSWQLSLRL